jgi:hypothetical protein
MRSMNPADFLRLLEAPLQPRHIPFSRAALISFIEGHSRSSRTTPARTIGRRGSWNWAPPSRCRRDNASSMGAAVEVPA